MMSQKHKTLIKVTTYSLTTVSIGTQFYLSVVDVANNFLICRLGSAAFAEFSGRQFFRRAKNLKVSNAYNFCYLVVVFFFFFFFFFYLFRCPTSYERAQNTRLHR